MGTIIKSIADWYLGRTEPANPFLWHRWNTVFSVRLIDGSKSNAFDQLWRRRDGDRWVYQVDRETDQHWVDRQM